MAETMKRNIFYRIFGARGRVFPTTNDEIGRRKVLANRAPRFSLSLPKGNSIHARDSTQRYITATLINSSIFLFTFNRFAITIDHFTRALFPANFSLPAPDLCFRLLFANNSTST